VEWFIRDIPDGVTIVSGGAVGVDKAAEEYAKRRGLPTSIYLPDLAGCIEKKDFTLRYYARNQQIVDDCDLLVAFTEKDYGGTWDTIKRARAAGKPVKIIKPSVFFPPEEAEEQKEEPEIQQTSLFDDVPSKGAGPFQIKRVSLGSYALRRKSYISSEEWAGFVTQKETDPEGLTEQVSAKFIDYFAKNKRFGFIHAITVPPRSIRNLEKPNLMDMVSQRVADELGVEWVRMFEPWEKSKRGRFATYGTIKVLPEVSRFVGKVVWVLDDVTTTNFTLRSAVQSLIALEIHAHGLAYVVMA
jgi:hypothetical protein